MGREEGVRMDEAKDRRQEQGIGVAVVVAGPAAPGRRRISCSFGRGALNSACP